MSLYGAVVQNLVFATVVESVEDDAVAQRTQEDTVRFEVVVDDTLRRELSDMSSRAVWVNRVMSEPPLTRMVTHVERVHCTMPITRIMLAMGSVPRPGTQIRCDMLFNMQCVIPDEGNVVDITKINALNIMSVLYTGAPGAMF